MEPMDQLGIYEIEAADTITLFTNQNFSGASVALHVASGEAVIKLVSGPVGETSRFSASFSVDCPELMGQNGAVLSSSDRRLATVVTVSCPVGYELSTRETSVTTVCELGGKWSVPRIPQCQPRYCGPPPIFPNAVVANISAFTFTGTAEYECLSGFTLTGGVTESVVRCTAEGTWTGMVDCEALKCSNRTWISDPRSHLVSQVVAGSGGEYG